MSINSSKFFHVNIVTPEEVISIQKAISACIETEDGTECFLTDHQDDSYILSTSMCQIQVDEDEQCLKKYFLGMGHVIFEQNTLTIVTQYAFVKPSESFKEVIKKEQIDSTNSTYSNALNMISNSIDSE